MNYSDYQRAFSPARLARYCNACNNDQNKAMRLYRLNVKLCQKFYGMLNILEIVLRNAINEHYKAHLNDPNWIMTHTQQGGIVELSPHQYNVIKTAQKLTAAGKYTHDRLVAGVSFGFWTYLFNKIPFRRGGQNLHLIFPNRPIGTGQKQIFRELSEIKEFRNKIAHHDPICFDTAGNIDLTFARSNRDRILTYLHYLGYRKEEILYGFDISTLPIMNKIDELAV